MNPIPSLPGKFYSLQWKLLIPLLLLGIVIFPSLNWVLNHIIIDKLQHLELRRAEQLVNSLRQAAEMVTSPEQLHRFVSTLGTEPDVKLIIIISGNPARVIASTRYLWLGKLLTQLPQANLGEELSQALQSQQPNYYHHPDIYEFSFSTPLLLSEGAQLKTNFYQGVVTVHLNTIPIQAVLYSEDWHIRLWIMLLLSILFIFIYSWFNQFIQQPLHKVAEAVQHCLNSNYKSYIPILAHDEIGIVANAINTLLIHQTQAQAEINKLALVAKYTDNAVVITDAEVRIEWVNEAFTRITGYGFEEVIGKRPGAFLHGTETDPTTIAKLRAALREQQALQAELVNYTKTGQSYWVALNIKPIYDGNGELIHFISVERDITERKQTDQQLQQQAQIINQIHDAVITTDKHYQITYWNPGAEKLYGYTAAEMNAQPITLLSLPEHRETLPETLLEPLLSTGSYEIEMPQLKKSGEVFFARLSLSLLGNSAGEAIGVISFAIDISQHEQLEAALKAEQILLNQQLTERLADLSVANTQLKKANQLKDEFLANMSHELRTPLNSILGMTEILSEQVYGQLNDRQMKSLQNINNSGHHLLALINDILDLAKIEAGRVELHLESFNIEEICQASLMFVKQLAYQKQLKLILEVAPQITTIIADQRRVKQILVNLLSNAVKFTPEKGSIQLEVKQNDTEHSVSFAVIDTGIGIETAALARLFNPFEQVTSEFATQLEGTGLGLALVKQLAELHGGSVTVTSQIGQGSCFTVILPLGQPVEPVTLEKTIEEAKIVEEAEVLSPITEPSVQHNSPLILIVEDNPNNIEIIFDYLTTFGYRVKAAYTGIEALTALTEERPSLILMDIQMPGMDGLETAKRIRANQEYQDLPIIAVTALTMPGDRERCLAIGMNEYLSKPINLRHLLQLVKQFSTKDIHDDS
jgi:PAS domain S-box-containing protein